MRLRLIKNIAFNQESGFILPVLLVTGLMIMLMIIAVSSETVTNQNVAVKGNTQVNAQLAADAVSDRLGGRSPARRSLRVPRIRF